jgi:hypothetical protein
LQTLKYSLLLAARELQWSSLRASQASHLNNFTNTHFLMESKPRDYFIFTRRMANGTTFRKLIMRRKKESCQTCASPSNVLSKGLKTKSGLTWKHSRLSCLTLEPLQSSIKRKTPPLINRSRVLFTTANVKLIMKNSKSITMRKKSY